MIMFHLNLQGCIYFFREISNFLTIWCYKFHPLNGENLHFATSFNTAKEDAPRKSGPTRRQGWKWKVTLPFTMCFFAQHPQRAKLSSKSSMIFSMKIHQRKSTNEISNEIPKIRVQIPLKSLMKLDHQFDGFSGGGSLQVWLGTKTACEVSNFKGVWSFIFMARYH